MNRATNLKPIPDARRFKRVDVSLKGALRIPGLSVAVVKTNNISEGGVSITTQDTLPLETGKAVELHLNGVLSNTQTKSLTTYNMKISHLAGKTIGLEFV